MTPATAPEAPCPKKIHVVYLDHSAELSGGEIALMRLLMGLPWVKAHVILGQDGPLVGHLRAVGATVEVLAFGPTGAVRKDSLRGPRAVMAGAVGTARYVWAVRRRLRALQPNLVHTNSLKSGFYGCLAARLAGIPAVWHLRDRLAEDYLPKKAIQLTRLATRFLPEAVVCNSHETQRYVAGSARRSWVVYDSATAPSGQECLDREEPFTFVMIGRMAPWKGQILFLDAFARAFPERATRARLVGSAMFGEDDYAELVRAHVAELGLGHVVELVGFREDIASELATADALVHCSLSAEPFGQVVVEGMAAGLPVIAAAAGGPAEIVHHLVDGLLFTPGSEVELATAMRLLVEEGSLRAKLSAAAVRRAMDFTPAHTGQAMMSLYADVVGGVSHCCH